MKWVKLLMTFFLLILAVVIVGPQPQPKDWSSVVGKNATESRAKWQGLTPGESLARGKPVQFFPKPNYPPTTDDNDPDDLTDGRLSTRADDRIWFNKDAVGWLGVGTATGILMVVDLGQQQPVGQIAIRMLGGKEQGGLELPSTIEYLASADGTHYHSLQRMSKLTVAESELSDFKTAFYVPEERKPFMFPFACRQPVRARYIALRVTPQSGLFVDQISIRKAEDATALKDPESYPAAQVFTEGVAITSKTGEFVVTTNITTPNWFQVQDFSGLDAQKSRAGFRLEMPEGLELLPQSKPAFKEAPSGRAGMRNYEFTRLASGGVNTDTMVRGPLYIAEREGTEIPENAIVTFTGLLDGNASHTFEYPLKLVEIPSVPHLRGLDVSLAWMTDGQEQDWPDFLESFRKLGFGFVSTFPRYFTKQNGRWSAASQRSLDFLQEARQKGYRIVYNESPFHIMDQNIRAAQKAGKIQQAEALEIFNQVNGKPGKGISPLYRGQHFQDEIKRVAEMTALVQPDHVYLDIEMWYPPVQESKQDPRVQAAWKASSKTWDEFITDAGTDALGSQVKAIRAAAPGKQLTVGLYNSDPGRPLMDGLFRWNKIYPGIVDIAMPSMYVQGRALDVAKRVRTDHDALQNRQIIPWLTAGTYGEFSSELMEPMVFESILSGARGVTYYALRDFDPMDFYYHSKALATLAKFPKLLQTGKPIAYQGENAALHYTGFASDTEALVLVGNYGRALQGKVNLPLPAKSVIKAVVVDGERLSIRNKSVSLAVPPGEFRLIHMTKNKLGATIP
ncbi:MAG: hypothetical protein ACR2M4_05360 [Actinomycetota bacterium]